MERIERLLAKNITFEEATIGGRFLDNVPMKAPHEARKHYKEIMQLNYRMQCTMMEEAKRVSDDKQREAAHQDFLKQSAIEWLGILKDWESLKKAPRTLHLWRHGLPSQNRPEVWALSIGNPLEIPLDMFMLLTMKAQVMQSRLDAEAATDAVSRTMNEDPDVCGPGSVKRDASLCLEIDLRRTFGSVSHFRDGPLLRTLYDIITAYCLYRPEVGYVQGMSYLAAVLVLHMDAVTAFVCFANLLHTRHFPYFYSMDQFAISKYFSIFDEMFERNQPQLHGAVKAVNAPSQMYLQNWYMTNYAMVLPLGILPAVWDLLFLSDVYFYRVGISIFRYFSHTILQSTSDGIMHFLTHIPKDSIDERAFLDIVHNTEVSESDLNAMKDVYGLL